MVFKMHKRITCAIALSLLFFSAGVSADESKASVAVKDETVLPEILAVSGNPSVIYGKGFPGTVTRTIRSSDKSAFFYASVRIVNPKKSKYVVKLECVDDAGNVVIEGTLQKEIFPMYRRRYMEGEIGQIEVSLGLNPTAGAKVAQQRMILKDDTQYFIRLYVEGRLISLTNFRYLIM